MKEDKNSNSRLRHPRIVTEGMRMKFKKYSTYSTDPADPNYDDGFPGEAYVFGLKYGTPIAVIVIIILKYMGW